MNAVQTQRLYDELYFNFLEEQVPAELRFHTVEQLLDNFDYIPIVSWHSGHARIIFGALLFVIGVIKTSAEAFANSTSQESGSSSSLKRNVSFQDLFGGLRGTTPSSNEDGPDNKLSRYQSWIFHGVVNVGRGVVAAYMPFGTGSIVLIISDIKRQRFPYQEHTYKDYARYRRELS